MGRKVGWSKDRQFNPHFSASCCSSVLPRRMPELCCAQLKDRGRNTMLRQPLYCPTLLQWRTSQIGR